MIPDEILLQVEKPARYIGNEINTVKKPVSTGATGATGTYGVEVRFAFCFPDVYEVGMSHLGMQIIYYFLNRRDDVFCERVFAPWTDMERLMRTQGLPLFALESGDDVRAFDFVAFTLQYEMSYTNLINMLDLAGIPIFSRERGDDAPIVCAGGPCAYNPEPLADFIDFFYIGEAEQCLDEIIDIYKANKRAGGGRAHFLRGLLALDCVYVPCFYDTEYNEDGTIKSFTPNDERARPVIRKAAVKNLDETFYPEKQLVPLTEIVHDRVTLELFRGCIRGCRFCQAGYIYRPVRERAPETLMAQAESLLAASGHEEISLVSLSTSDYSDVKALTEGIIDRFSKDYINISLPSLRVDACSVELMSRVQAVRKSGLTFAPEAGTQRLRDVINKGLTSDEILGGCELAFAAGFDRIKLYFMVGLPTETDEDLAAIGLLADRIRAIYYRMPFEARRRNLTVNVATSCFVPKPFTPFQWEAQDSYETFMEKQRAVKRSINPKRIQYSYNDAMISTLEGAVARGDRRMGAVIYNAWKSGARFDGWSDIFDNTHWDKAFAEAGLDKSFFASRKRSFDEILPWDHISTGVSKEFLISEAKRAYSGDVTPNCREGCAGCGIDECEVAGCGAVSGIDVGCESGRNGGVGNE